ncbi:sensor histidine kinase [Devosia pacifica]|uniref:histidine kinase n=1 Tax=Devosia pacifica TaxID=1335967 RepID=A0A918VN90_9HYPH|nr:sensor histidine kinase [Devosia pacifica]
MDVVPRILNVVCKTTGMGFAAVARVTAERWVACDVMDSIAFGLKAGDELPIETTICQTVRELRKEVVIDDVAGDDVYRSHPVPAMYNFKSYASFPILLEDGTFFGTLCAIDPEPAKISSPEVREMFRLFAELIAQHLDAGSQLSESEARLSDAEAFGDLREQFIAVLGHDLRSPLASISSGARLLSRSPLDERSQRIVMLIQSTVVRMTGLVDNLLDFARGRLGDGLSLNVNNSSDIERTLQQVIEELRSGHPEHEINTAFNISHTVSCDEQRVAQLVSNLISNALTHGASDEPIRISAETTEEDLQVRVTNGGRQIPTEVREHLFDPFSRGSASSSGKGLGLGLYIASEIAHAHGGSLDVASSEQETTFTLRLPLEAAQG